jgi:hypothetical protein
MSLTAGVGLGFGHGELSSGRNSEDDEDDSRRATRPVRARSRHCLGRTQASSTACWSSAASPPSTTYPPNVKYVGHFTEAQRSAREAGRGLWGACSAETEEEQEGEGTPPSGGGNCTPGYDPCLPPASDYDCAGGEGDGPEYATGPIRVTGSDPYGLDADGDGVACEA